MSDERAVAQIIVIGASAGGVNALSTVVSALPAEFPVPIVVAQHVDPRQPSHLAEVLAARTPLPVTTVTDAEPLAAGTIYVVPAGRHVEIADHEVRVANGNGGPRPSIDRLLESAARSFGHDLIAVILSGFGADGAVGAQIVKALGGTVIVENPETAAFPSMPGRVPAPSVDIVADLPEIGSMLVDLVSGRYAIPAAEESQDLAALLTRVRERSGLDFEVYKRPTIERRLQRRMAAVGMPTVADYRRYIERHPEELQRLVASFLIKVTQFFRDPELFTYLRERVLPDLVAEARRRDSELRIWSAGCATGEEAYTLAILTAELVGADGEELPVRIFATDAATEAIDYARRGIYPGTALANLPPDVIDRHFSHFDGLYEVRKNLRQMVIFGDHDLSHRAPFPRTDLVLCRNVLIYFTAELQRRVLERFAFSLRQGGYLVLGKSESVSPLPDFFDVEQPRLKVYRRIGESLPIPVTQLLGDATPPPHDRVTFGSRAPARRNPVVSPPTYLGDQRYLGPPLGRLFDGLPMGIVVVDRHYDIHSLNVAARRLFGLHVASFGEDLIHRLPAALAQTLRTAIDAAFQGEVTTLTHHAGAHVLDEDERHLRIVCTPAEPTAAGGETGYVAVVVDDITETTRRERDLEREAERTARAMAEVRSLRRTTEQMSIELGHLRSENDALQIANEEVQAAAEEIEALNEEAQAANEELETLNEEMQATVEELRTANEELQARGTELQLLAAAHEQERERLEAVLAGIGDAVLVVDRQGRPALTNTAYQRMFGREEAFRPEDESGQPLTPEEWPQARAARGETFSMTFTVPGADGARRRYEATAQPLERRDETHGGVLTIRDITERARP